MTIIVVRFAYTNGKMCLLRSVKFNTMYLPLRIKQFLKLNSRTFDLSGLRDGRGLGYFRKYAIMEIEKKCKCGGLIFVKDTRCKPCNREHSKKQRQKESRKEYIRNYQKSDKYKAKLKLARINETEDQKEARVKWYKDYYSKPEVAEKRKIRRREYVKEYYQRPHVKAKRQAYAKTKKGKAAMALNESVRLGKITKKPCELCGFDGYVEGHHWSYEKKNWLNVHWLCKPCHCQIHKDMKGSF